MGCNILPTNSMKTVNPLFNTICFWIMTIDILFLPYLSFVAISGSVVLVAVWAMCNYRKIIYSKEGFVFAIMLILMFFGTLCCLFYTGTVRFETTIETAIKRFFQYALCFCYYFFYKDYFSKHRVNVKKILFTAIIFMVVLAIIFKMFPYEYALVKIKLNPADNHTRRYLAGMVNYRFNYFWTDPNNVSYLVAGIAAWFLLQADAKNISKFIVLIASTFIAFCTVSNGGLLILIIMSLIVLFIQIRNSLQYGVKRKTIFFVVTVILLVIIFIKATNIGNVIRNDYLSNYITRISFYSDNTFSAGGRLEDLLYSFEYLNPIMLIIGTGKEGFVTEIGHIYWIGMYGVPSYLMFMWQMFRKTVRQSWSQYIWIIPFFVGFTMNIAIGEFKWMAIYLMLLAYSRKSKLIT